MHLNRPSRGILVSTLLVLPHAASAAEQARASYSQQCDTICHQITDGSTIGSLGDSIESTIINSGNCGIITGGGITGTVVGYEPSAIWNLWAHAFEVNFPSGLSHLPLSGNAGDRICIDRVTLAKLTAAASQCHLHATGGIHGAGGGGSSSSWSFSSSTGTGDAGGMGTRPNTVNTGTGGSGGVLTDQTNGGTVGVSPDQAQSGGGGSFVSNSGGGGGANVDGGSSSSSSSSSTSTGGGHSTHNTWGSGGVGTDICFRIKDKRSDRYLTSGGAEYAFAYYPTYSSVFRAHASKSVEGGYTLTETRRNTATVNYPVKLNVGLGQFKPLYGDKDAIFTFAPARFGDSCWGVPGKKMARRHDWGGWGDNYRQSTTAEESCADIELEEADC